MLVFMPFVSSWGEMEMMRGRQDLSCSLQKLNTCHMKVLQQELWEWNREAALVVGDFVEG